MRKSQFKSEKKTKHECKNKNISRSSKKLPIDKTICNYTLILTKNSYLIQFLTDFQFKKIDQKNN